MYMNINLQALAMHGRAVDIHKKHLAIAKRLGDGDKILLASASLAEALRWYRQNVERCLQSVPKTVLSVQH